MTCNPTPSQPAELPVEQAAPHPPGDQPPAVNSADLLNGHRELLIHHEGETYRLRLTKTGKLILNK